MMALRMILVRVSLSNIAFVLGVKEETGLEWLERAARKAEEINTGLLKDLPVTEVLLDELWSVVKRDEIKNIRSCIMIAIVDYKAGNLTSVRLALQALNAEAQVTNDPDVVRQAYRVIFPGVGAAGAAMGEVFRLGLKPALLEVIDSGRPFLGICVGTQILLEFSEENGGTPCLGIIPGQVKRFQSQSHYDKIPQIGWNTVHFTGQHPLFEGIEDNAEFYFVHSYYPSPSHPEHSLGETAYADAKFSSILGRDNLIATQFHPERSGRIGLRLLRNFCKWDGTC